MLPMRMILPHKKKIQPIAKLCHLKVKKDIFHIRKHFIAINNNITNNAIFIPHNAMFCDGIEFLDFLLKL